MKARLFRAAALSTNSSVKSFTTLRRAITHSLRRVRVSVALTRRAVVNLVLMVAYLTAVIGYPDYRPVASKEAGEPYPCQFSSCGCRTREQCRTSCCCHTKAEKVAWAQARGIDPNRVAVLTAAEQTQLARGIAKPASECQKCSSGMKCCCQAKAQVVKKPSCCDKKPAPAGLKFVLGIEAQKCRGAGVDWIQAGFVALPPQAVTITLAQPVSSATAVVSQRYLSPTLGRLERPG